MGGWDIRSCITISEGRRSADSILVTKPIYDYTKDLNNLREAPIVCKLYESSAVFSMQEEPLVQESEKIVKTIVYGSNFCLSLPPGENSLLSSIEFSIQKGYQHISKIRISTPTDLLKKKIFCLNNDLCHEKSARVLTMFNGTSDIQTIAPGERLIVLSLIVEKRHIFPTWPNNNGLLFQSSDGKFFLYNPYMFF